MNYRPLRFFFCGLMFSWGAFAAAEPLNLEQLKQVQKKLQGKDYLTVDFVQSFFSSLRKTTTTFSGTGYFAKPGKFRWNQEKPQRKEFIFSGKELVQFLPEQNAATKFSSSDTETQRFNRLSNLVLNVNALFDEYDLISANRAKNKAESVVTVVLKPKGKSDVEKVELEISETKNHVRSVVLNYTGGKQYKYIFTNPRFDIIKDSVFTFVPPAGVKLESFP